MDLHPTGQQVLELGCQTLDEGADIARVGSQRGGEQIDVKRCTLHHLFESVRLPLAFCARRFATQPRGKIELMTTHARTTAVPQLELNDSRKSHSPARLRRLPGSHQSRPLKPLRLPYGPVRSTTRRRAEQADVGDAIGPAGRRRGPFMTPELGRRVYDHIITSRPGQALELGTAHGVSPPTSRQRSTRPAPAT